MEDMKSDMAGAAAVIATVCLVAQLGLPVEVTATVPIAENLPSGTAYRPADVVTFRNGKKAEITNTDAEGRVVLADAIAARCRGPPRRAAGDLDADRRAAGGARHPHRPASWAATTCATPSSPPSARSGEAHVADAAAAGAAPRAWTPPSPTSSTPTPTAWAACSSAGTSSPSSCPAGLPWAHIDIAGPSYNTGAPWGYTPKGGTGVPVRTLLATIEDLIAD